MLNREFRRKEKLSMFRERTEEEYRQDFLKNIITTQACWDWKGCKDEKGYGLWWYRGKHIRIHRMSWLIFNGMIPNKLHVLHRCDNPICSNPDHLFLGTHKDNMEDMSKKGRASNQGQKRTHCKRGHLFGEDNFLWKPNKTEKRYKTCKTCAKEARTKRKEEISFGQL